MSKWALILGGSTGLGLASAKKLAKEKFNLVIFFRDRKAGAEKAEEVFNDMRALGVDVLAFNRDAIRLESIDEAVSELREKLKGNTFQIVLHSIAKGNLKLMGPYKEVTPRTPYTEEMVGFLDQEFSGDTQFLKGEDFTLTIEAMATSFYSWSKALFDAALIGEGTSLLAFTSEGARKAWRNYGAVSAAKAALEAISRSMALEYAPYGIRSNIIQAGVTDTAALNKIKGNQMMKEQSMLRNPFGRLTQPEDVGNVVYLMSLPEARWINGAIIPVDGGESIA